MAGSAINLGGMLSQMSESMGGMGQTVGSAMFNPMLKLQEEERIRKQAEMEKATALAKGQATAASYSGPMAAFEKAKANDNPQGMISAGNAMMKAAELAADPLQQREAQRMLSEVKGAENNVAMGRIENINKALVSPGITSEATDLLTKEKEKLMMNPHVASEMNKKVNDQNEKDRHKLTVERAERDKESHERVTKAEADALAREKGIAAAKARAWTVPVNASEQDLTKAMAGMNDFEITAFKQTMATNAQTQANRNAINMSEQMSKEEFDNLGLDYSWETYNNSTSRITGWTTINESLLKAHAKKIMDAENPTINPQVAEKHHVTAADDMLKASVKRNPNHLWLTADKVDEGDKQLIATARANGIMLGEFPDIISHGALTPEGRTKVVNALNAAGIAATHRKKSYADMTPEEINAEHQRMLDEQAAAAAKE